MGTDVLAYNALARSIDGIRDQIAEKRRLRDSAIAAIPAIDSAVTYTCGLIDSLGTYWQARIDSADSYIATATPNIAGGYDNECWHAKFQSCTDGACGWEGIKLLCHCSGTVASDFCVMNCNGNEWQCGSSCSITIPAGVSKIMFAVQGGGGPSLMANCCGGSTWGTMGGYLQTTFCVSEGDTFLACSACAYCCWPYCCGYTLYRTPNSYVCTCIGGVAGCMMVPSPHPHGCCEQYNRQCLAQGLEDGALPQAFGGCWTIWHQSQCLCGSEGNSVCNNSYGQCCYYCYGPGGNYCYTDGPYTVATQHVRDYICPPTSSGSACDITKMVPGSCFRVHGKYHGSWNSNNCYWVCTFGSPASVAWYGGGYVCCLCMQYCCPGYCWSASQGYDRMPGHGGRPHMACGGASAMYSDMGTFGAVRVQWC